MANKNFRVKHGLEVGNNASTHATINATSFTFTGATTLTGNATISGNVGIGNTAPIVKLHITATDAIFLPAGNTAQRPTGANGMFRYNNELDKFEGFSAGAWGAVGGSGGYYKGNEGTAGIASSANSLFRINSNTMTANITILAGENALTTGPIAIANGISLIIDTGGRAVIA